MNGKIILDTISVIAEFIAAYALWWLAKEYFKLKHRIEELENNTKKGS